MTATGDAIGIVGDNIANVNTFGYKDNRANFDDVLGGSLSDVLGGSLGNSRLGAGVRLGGQQMDLSQGTLQQTGGALDLAINGNGFFEVNGATNGANGSCFTRNGQFSLNNSGFVVNPDGLKLQGFLINSDGTTSTAASSLQLAGTTSPPVATSKVSMTVSLDSTAQPIPDPANAGQFLPNFQTSVTTYDSLGAAHQITMNFTRSTTAGPNGDTEWNWTAAANNSEISEANGNPPVPATTGQSVIASGTLDFTTNGALDVSAVVQPTDVTFTGATKQTIDFAGGFGDPITPAAGGVAGTGVSGTTMYAGASTVTATNSDGRSAGQLLSVSVGIDGTIDGVFDNGDNRALAQVAIASFANPEGLNRDGDGLYVTTQASGQALLAAAGTGGRGGVQGGSLEASNVDLGNDLVTMITYQRSFQSDSRIVTAADQMLQEVAQLGQ